MKRKIDQSVSILLIILIVFGITLSSCENEDKEPMNLPTDELLVIDINQFPSKDAKSAELFFGNWAYSALSVFAWNAVLAINVAIPIAAYREAFNHQPVYQGNNSWEWSYTVALNRASYEASLIGTRLDNEKFSMEMTLSQVGGFQDFKWFTGEIRYDHTAATWIISHSPDARTEYLQVEYSKDYEADSSSLRYTVIDPENELYNSYIEYGLNAALDFNAYYTISRKDTLTYIQWDTTTNAGRVMDEVYFKDEVWHCWDSQLLDVDCSAE